LPNDVTVVVPTHNRAMLVRRTLTSILAQRDVDLEVAVVDDGSRDATPETLTAIADPRVRVIRNEAAQGVSNARNRGLESTTAAWVAFCDDDDVWAPDKLRRQIDALTGRPDAVWSSAGAVAVDEQLHLNGPEMHPPPDGDVSPLLLARNLVPGGASSVVARTELVRELGGFDRTLSVAADFDLWIRLALAGPHAGVDEPLVGYLVRPGSMAHDTRTQRHDLTTIERRYARERGQRGVELAWRSYLRYMGAGQLRGGHRVAAARTHLELALRYRDREAWSLLWRGTIAPARVQAARDVRLSASMPPSWRAASTQWLATLAAGLAGA
jgi:glycosyltransferase involved in cell wall biosynthesis